MKRSVLIALTAIAVDGSAGASSAAAAALAGHAFGFDESLRQLATVAFDVPYELALFASLWLLTNHGTRGYFRGSLLGFATACLAATVAPSAGIFMTARMVAGASLGGLYASALLTIVRSTKPEGMKRVFAFFTFVALAAPMLGPWLDGLAIAFGGWRAGFALLAIVPAVAGVAAGRFIDDEAPPQAKRFDTASFLALGLLLLAVHHLFAAGAMLEALERNVESAVALVAAAWLALREVRLADDPFIDIAPLRQRFLRNGLSAALLTGIAFGTTAAIVPFAQIAFGAASTGTMLGAVRAIGAAAGAIALFAVWQHTAIENRVLAAAGLAGFALTFFADAACTGASSPVPLTLISILQGFAAAFVIGPLASMLFGAAPQTQFAPLAILFKIALVIGSAMATPIGALLGLHSGDAFTRLWIVAGAICIVAAATLATNRPAGVRTISPGA